MGRAQALAGAAIGTALAGAVAGTVDPRLSVPAVGLAVAMTVLLSIGATGRFLPGRGVRLALVSGAFLVAARVAASPPAVPAMQASGSAGTGPAAVDPAAPDPRAPDPTVAGPAAAAPAVSGASAVTGASVQFGTVESVIRRAGGKQSAILALGAAGLVYAQLPRYPELVPGDRVAVEGRLEPLPAEPEAASAGWVAYLRRIGVGATIEVSGARQEGSADDPAAWLARLRSGAGDLLGIALPEPLAGLASGILIGLRERVDPTLVREFTASGLTHVVAISGWNIAIVGATCGALTRPLSRRRRSFVIGAVIAGYTLFAGASPSVVRAALMAAVALLARESGRRAGASRALALAIVAMLVIDPGAVVDPGFQLSSCATAGLVAWATPLGERLAVRAPRLPAAVRETLAVSLSAQFATLPIVLLDFGRLSLVSPAANLVAAPLIPFVMAGAAFALPLGALLGAGVPALLVSVPLGLAALPLGLLVAIVHTAASLPYASVELPAALAAPAAGLAACLVLVVARSASRNAPPRRDAKAAARP